MGSTSKDIKEEDKRLLEGVIQKKKKQQSLLKYAKKHIAGIFHEKEKCQLLC